jgi:DNA-directed RNA polymerase subunit RPC12/RpoP
MSTIEDIINGKANVCPHCGREIIPGESEPEPEGGP